MTATPQLSPPLDHLKGHRFTKGDPRAAAAARKGNANRRELTRIAKGELARIAPLAHTRDATPRLTQLRRLQRRTLNRLNGCDTPAEMLEAAKACRELFEMEMELLGRRPLKTGKVPRDATAEQTRKALTLPDVATLPQDPAPDLTGLPELPHVCATTAPGSDTNPSLGQQTKLEPQDGTNAPASDKQKESLSPLDRPHTPTPHPGA